MVCNIVVDGASTAHAAITTTIRVKTEGIEIRLNMP
jgi:hypothetical protein